MNTQIQEDQDINYLPSLTEGNNHLRQMAVQFFQEVAAKGDGSIALIKDIEAHLNCKIGGRIRYHVNKAIAILRADYGINFEVVRGRGFEYVAPGRVAPQIKMQSEKKIKAATSEWRTKHESVDPARFSTQKELTDYIRAGLKLRYQEDVLSDRTADQIEAAIEPHTITQSNLKQVLLKARQDMMKMGVG